ncbi:hypothetical protein IMSAGC022_01576 [Alistipes sp.]|nr:hypothetical protein IMSAGC022_01576 [Alistipes sp.]
MEEILKSHSQSQRIIQLLKLLFLHVPETVKYDHILWLIEACRQRIRLLHAGLPGIHRIDTVRLDRLELFVRDDPAASLYHIGRRRMDHRLLVLLDKLYALYG